MVLPFQLTGVETAMAAPKGAITEGSPEKSWFEQLEIVVL